MHLHSFLLYCSWSVIYRIHCNRCLVFEISNKIKAKAETEDKKAADVLNWLEDNITKEDIENSYAGDIQEEMKYFNRTAYVKEQLTVQFTDLSDEEAENFSEQFVEKMFN